MNVHAIKPSTTQGDRQNDTPQVAGLTWSLAIATYQRADVLRDCVKLAVAQTRPPCEIIVVDASPDWQQTRERMIKDLDALGSQIPLRFEQARAASSAKQRNQCIEMALGDVLFLIDDDSLMWPDCAEQVMRVYDHDPQAMIAGVAVMETSADPRQTEANQPANEQAKTDSASPPTMRPSQSHPAWVRWVRRVLSADDLFVPYDHAFPAHPLPDTLGELPVGTRKLMAGKTMTMRRDVAQREPFCDLLDRASNGEDSDMSYRASRHGALVTALQAKLFHVGSAGGRMKVYQTTLLGSTNPLVHHRLHSTDLSRSRARIKSLLRRRLVIAFLKDLRARSFALPRTRAMGQALRKVDTILGMSVDELLPWYTRFQQSISKG